MAGEEGEYQVTGSGTEPEAAATKACRSRVDCNIGVLGFRNEIKFWTFAENIISIFLPHFSQQ
jgi:hypothetical protein